MVALTGSGLTENYPLAHVLATRELLLRRVYLFHAAAQISPSLSLLTLSLFCVSTLFYLHSCSIARPPPPFGPLY